MTLMKRFCKENPVERIGYQKDGVHDIRKHRWFQVGVTISVQMLLLYCKKPDTSKSKLLNFAAGDADSM